MVNLDNNIELGRQFIELSVKDVEQTDIDAMIAWGSVTLPTWPDLLQQHRVVLLSSAGTGKSWEVAHQSRTLREGGKSAFYLRLEDLVEGFDDTVFEQGDAHALQSAITRGEEVWLFLDSIDEARLGSPRAFEKALKHLKPILKDHLQYTHLILTSRIGAWRPVDDALRLGRLFPFKDQVQSGEGGELSPIKYYTLRPLTSEQMRLYAQGKHVENAEEMITEIERTQMVDLAGRPKDLDDIISFWATYKRLGSRLEMIEASITRKLIEHDLDRAARETLTPEQTNYGAMKLAAAASLTQQAKIIVPDQHLPKDGFASNAVLQDWSVPNCASLIGRPIFEPETYGFVRFDHRDTKEFLAAKWFLHLIALGQRRRVEALFFKKQYGVDIVVPSLRPVLPWIALFDAPIRTRIIHDWPEILLEGGDPASLPLEDRKSLLTHYCAKLAESSHPSISFDQSALQRLISTDMVMHIRLLASEYAGNEWIERLLMRSIEIGLLTDLVDLAIEMACAQQQSQYTRQSAMRAVRAVASEKEMASTSLIIAQNPSLTDRRALADFLESFDSKHIPAQTLVELISNLRPPIKHKSDGLNRAVQAYVATCSLDAVQVILENAADHLKSKPFIEKPYFEVSKKHAWMLNFAIPACERLVEARHQGVFLDSALRIMSLVNASRDYEIRDAKTNLGETIPAWSELNTALFWHDVADARRGRKKRDGSRLTEWWKARIYGHQWRFTAGNLDLAIGWITEKKLHDDKLVALSLAFTLYCQASRPQAVRRRLWKTVDGNEELSIALKGFLNPPPKTEEEKRSQRSHSQWERRYNARQALTQGHHADWKKALPNQLAQIRNEILPGEGKIWTAQSYLFDRMREKREDTNRWSQPNWRDLIEEYGEDVAEAMRDGLIDTWRRYRPGLISEKQKDAQSTPHDEIMGLSGLEIEAVGDPNWPSTLDNDEALRASRYLMSELNGFPTWFKAFAGCFPEITYARISAEIEWEFFGSMGEQAPHYVLSDILYHAPWYGVQIAPHLFKLLSTGNPKHLQTLERALSILLRIDTISDQDVADLASITINTAQLSNDQKSLWYAAWVSVEPEIAIAHLTDTLSELQACKVHDPSDVKQKNPARDFAIVFINALSGTRQERALGVRENHQTAPHLKDLHLLMHQYIRTEEDINRLEGGGYSPTSRDDAQDARGRLYNALCDISGKEAFDALVDIAELANDENERAWRYGSAYARARADADHPWAISKVNEFEVDLEMTPTMPRELFDIAVNRLLDLKHDYEDGNFSPASVVIRTQLEEELRNYLAGELQRVSQGRYSISQEDEMPNEQRTDIRFMHASVSGMVPVELKIADKWSGNELIEKLRLQLCGDYLRDANNENGIYLLVNRGAERKKWRLPEQKLVNFEDLIEALQAYAAQLTTTDQEIRQIGVSNLQVIGIDLSKRAERKQ